MTRHNSPNPSPDLKEAIESGLIKRPKRCLDLGCGNGRNTRYLTHLPGKLFGICAIDKQKEVPSQLVHWRTVNNLTIVSANIENGLPFIKDNYVNLVLLQFTLMFIDPEKRKFLAEEITRVGCDGAQLLLSWYDAKTSYGGNLRKEIDTYTQLGWETLKEKRSSDVRSTYLQLHKVT